MIQKAGVMDRLNENKNCKPWKKAEVNCWRRKTQNGSLKAE